MTKDKLSNIVFEFFLKYKHKSLLECPLPPKGEFVSHSISFTNIEDEIWSGTEITYTCVSSHSFKWGESATRTCGRDGNWNNDVAPICVPGKFIIFKTNLGLKSIGVRGRGKHICFLS